MRQHPHFLDEGTEVNKWKWNNYNSKTSSVVSLSSVSVKKDPLDLDAGVAPRLGTHKFSSKIQKRRGGYGIT